MEINRRILIVDDNREIHDDFRKILLSTGDGAPSLTAMEERLFGGACADANRSATADVCFEVFSAFQGEEAVAMVKQAAEAGVPYAMAFMDMRMPPGCDGLVAIERLWSVCPDIQVVLCSAYSDYSWDKMVGRLGKNDNFLLLKKPFEPGEVQQLALALTTKWSMAKEVRRHITELKDSVDKTTSALEDQRARALFSSKMATLGEMAGGIAHEINTPLGAIQLNAESAAHILSGPDPDREALIKISSNIVDTVKRIARVVSGLRVISKDAGNEPFRLTPVVEFADNAFALCQQKFNNHGIKTDFPSIPPSTRIKCRGVQLSQVMINLLNNAYDAVAGQPEKWIRVEFIDGEKGVELSVTDSGAGITPEILPRIFQPFVTGKEIGKGMGLGLTISKSIIEEHGGSLDLDMRSPHTRFVITLPKTRE